MQEGTSLVVWEGSILEDGHFKLTWTIDCKDERLKSMDDQLKKIVADLLQMFTTRTWP